VVGVVIEALVAFLLGYIAYLVTVLSWRSDWFDPSSVREFRVTLAQIQRGLAALTKQGAAMADEIAALKAAQGKTNEAFGRLANEVREMATKLGNVADLTEVGTIATELSTFADGIDALRAEVDTDGSNAPAPVEI
jgi:hypothetical protein